MFTRIGAAAFKKDLTNTIALCDALANPELKFKSIHIAGTNGKGSTSHMLASILQAQGYKTGLYTSPHLKDFRERIRINGKMISKAEVRSFVKNQQNLIENLKPSFFEVTVAMAFDHFAKNQVDIAVIEVGLGGRLDSTNVITPEISVITNISLDHTNLLGNTIREIAGEKAGIIKHNIPVVIGESQSESKPVFINKAKEVNAPIYFADDEYTIQNAKKKWNVLNFDVFKNNQLQFENLKTDLTGTYQTKNILTVLATCEKLNETSSIKINSSSIYDGLKQVKKLTGLQGRWQTLAKNPLIICDTGHNEAGITEVVKNINSTKFDKLHVVFGMVNDKDISKVLALMPKNASYYFCKPNLERGLDAEDLKFQASAYHLKGNSFASVIEAKKAALKQASINDLIFIGGSTFVVAEVI